LCTCGTSSGIDQYIVAVTAGICGSVCNRVVCVFDKKVVWCDQQIDFFISVDNLRRCENESLEERGRKETQDTRFAVLCVEFSKLRILSVRNKGKEEKNKYREDIRWLTHMRQTRLRLPPILRLYPRMSYRPIIHSYSQPFLIVSSPQDLLAYLSLSIRNSKPQGETR